MGSHPPKIYHRLAKRGAWQFCHLELVYLIDSVARSAVDHSSDGSNLYHTHTDRPPPPNLAKFVVIQREKVVLFPYSPYAAPYWEEDAVPWQMINKLIMNLIPNMRSAE